MNPLNTLLFHDVYQDRPDESGFRGAAADRYKLPLDAFRRQLRSIGAVRDDAPVDVTRVPQSPGSAPWAFSVDDGGISYHSLLAPLLAERGWIGHCLVTTDRLGQPGFLHPRHVRELHDAGHVIGSHTASHPRRIDACGWNRLVDEWARSKAVLEDITGSEILVGSVPGGYFVPRVARAAREAGLRFLFTSEPETTTRLMHDCRVLGRYTIRRNSPDDLAGRLLRPRDTARMRQWAAWNVKKVIKKALGTGYIHLSGRLAREAPARPTPNTEE